MTKKWTPPTYSPEEIRKWKDIIYGNNGDFGKVHEWAGAESAPTSYVSPRKKVEKKKWGSTESPRSETNDWLIGDSPTKAKKSYKTKGTMNTKTPF
mmetsp:Transcript_26183/g.42968  ORF Transcript_26183/g.42968 Transcript_26183/m.42968 type:complete len:96 (-) Transcript_26183:256-543(-)|eukprot:CAMPEP_0178759026 /NCGR_PEP_ID=MMETSP0744-20121128/14707_1 /TAXON_ID=913974 /ORGANISM="Nitzschia punctata, Strain CCMP561" /LENGTH=95 /DNA_ID=CAMNT_0020413445 /DNA_START=40 /DNA_END=327 /DNA_ORIENTATION=+